jgi:hypothetical protein
MAEVTSGVLTVVVLDEEEAEQLQELLNTHLTLHEDFPALVALDLGLGA